MSTITTRQLFSQIQEKLIIDLKDDEMLCPDCKGLRFKYIENNGMGYIKSCRRCYTGVLNKCKYCGKGNTSWCNCREAYNERDNEYRTNQAKKEFEAYQKAEKIHYKDYGGKFWIESYSSYIIDIDDVAEWIHEKLSDNEEVPEYLWALKAERHFSIDLQDVISNKCEDGYEEMYSHLNTDSPLLAEAQKLIDQWEKEQGDSLCVYYEDYKKAVIIKDLIEEVRKEIESSITHK